MGGLLPTPKTTKATEDGAGGPRKRWAYGVSDMQGWRQAMEDAHVALPDFDPARGLGLFGVFDGHGGAAVARVAAERLPGILRSQPAFAEGRYADALGDAFLAVDAFLDGPQGRKLVAAAKASGPDASDPEDEEDGDDEEDALLRRLMDSGEMEAEEEEEEQEDEEEEEEDDEATAGNSAWANGEGPDGMGCTAVVALVRDTGVTREVFVANAGDSRCLLARGDRAVDMSEDHKPTNKTERQRIQKAGGFVTAEGRVDGNLNLSRAFGDFAYKKDRKLKPQEQKISCEAEVRHKALRDEDRYLVLGCDGIFEKATNQVLLDFLHPRLQARGSGSSAAPSVARRKAAAAGAGAAAKLSSVCSAFLDHNVAKNPMKEQGLGCDNMTLMIVDLQATSSSAPATSRSLSSQLASARGSPGGRKGKSLEQRSGGERRFPRRSLWKDRRRRLLMLARFASRQRRQQRRSNGR
eukprot:TRINITY_DN45402_c0_g1_i1.p1 TRINITY_DN45402_c0_g1~~TRINITY_DN45402_c0_g1_i1.p1  ORF type:complete len:466 (-),score=139.31 TRINITY_DN45402_c0_g1_i1:29-1426(-)